MPSFGERLKELRKENRLTQDKLAQQFCLNKSSISRYEKNIQMPETELLQSIADFFEVSIDYLLGRTDIKHSHTAKNNTEEFNPSLNKKDNLDIEKHLNSTLKMLESQDGIMLDGKVLDNEDIEILAKSIKLGLEYAKLANKKKYTPKKYRKNF